MLSGVIHHNSAHPPIRLHHPDLAGARADRAAQPSGKTSIVGPLALILPLTAPIMGPAPLAFCHISASVIQCLSDLA
jgi:hypothetical protein